MVEKFGLNIRRLRLERNLTQRQVAVNINVSVQAYSRYEKNICEPSLQVLISLAEYFGVLIDELVK